MAEESLARPFYTVLVLALVCSALVAGATVGLRPYQEANRQLDRKRTILRAAGLYEGESTSIHSSRTSAPVLLTWPAVSLFPRIG
jgi:Na+-transporting NADH:ubiquinone oxidoreductase subunit NqrC